jgi:hypothetical protein
MANLSSLPQEILEEILILCDTKSFLTIFLLNKTLSGGFGEHFFQRYIQQHYVADAYNITEWNTSIFENKIFATSTWKDLFLRLNNHKSLLASVQTENSKVYLSCFSIKFGDTYRDIISNFLTKIPNKKQDCWTIKISGIFYLAGAFNQNIGHDFTIYIQNFFGTLRTIIDPISKSLNIDTAIGTLDCVTSESLFNNIISIQYCGENPLVDKICALESWHKRYMTESIL